MMIASQAASVGYPISAVDARSALRSVGAQGMQSFAHRLAVEMRNSAQEEKLSKWRKVIGHVFFEGVWPLDIELQTSSATFDLVTLLLESGAAFPEAVQVIVPFVRPEVLENRTSVFSISGAPDDLFASSPEKMLDLVYAVVAGDGTTRSVHRLSEVLDRIL